MSGGSGEPNTTSRRTWSVSEDGKHTVVVASRSELSTPSTVSLPPPEPAPGLILPDGSINWGCPCLGGMATGPCGTQFRDAFSCFHYSEAEPKGSDCYEKFSVMQECMAQYPELYGKDDDDDELAAAMEESAATSEDSTTKDEKKEIVTLLKLKTTNLVDSKAIDNSEHETASIEKILT